MELTSASYHGPPSLINLCRRCVQHHDSKAGEDVLKYLRGANSQSPNSADALTCLQMAFTEKTDEPSVQQDMIISELIKKFHALQKHTATQFRQSTTEFFEDMFHRGDGAASCLRDIVRKPQLWTGEIERMQVRDDLFSLFLAKFLESDLDYNARALRNIAHMLRADPLPLFAFIDEVVFHALLDSLHVSLPADIRELALSVVSKFAQLSGQEARCYFKAYASMQVAKQSADGLTIVFSVASQSPPAVSGMATQCLLHPNVLRGLMALLQKRITHPTIHTAFLSVLDATCDDSSYRCAIKQHCSTWLLQRVNSGDMYQSKLAVKVLRNLSTQAEIVARGARQQTVSDFGACLRTPSAMSLTRRSMAQAC